MERRPASTWVTRWGVARVLGPDQYGLLGYAQSIASIAFVVASLGIDNIIVRQLVLEPAKMSEYLSGAAFLRFGAGVLRIASGNLLGHFPRLGSE